LDEEVQIEFEDKPKSLMKKVFLTKPLAKYTTGYASYCFIVLLFISILEEADKFALPTLQGAGLQCASCGNANSTFYEKCISMCLPISDMEFGLLSGPTLALSTAILGLPIGRLADTYSRVRILFVGLMIWTTATFLNSFATEFWHLVLTRVFLGLGVSTVKPTIFSLNSDYFSHRWRSIILAITASMMFIGLEVGFASSIISLTFTWRTVFLIFGGAGILAGPILLITVRDPIRGGNDDSYDSENPNTISNSIWQDLKDILKKPIFIFILLASIIHNVASYGQAGWLQVFFRRKFGLSAPTISFYLAIIVPVAGIVGSYGGGYIADKWSQKTALAKAWLGVISGIGASIFAVPMLIGYSDKISFLCFFLSFLMTEMWLGPTLANVQGLVPPTKKSLITAIFFTISAIGSVGPLIIGILTQTLGIEAPFGNENSKYNGNDPSLAMFLIVPTCFLLSAICFGITVYLQKKALKNSL